MSAIAPGKCTLYATLLIVGIALFYLGTIRDGHVWGDDHAMYIAHARNIVEGRAYAETGYLRSPSSINPAMYPPVYPLLIALPYSCFGLNLTAMKVENVILFAFALGFLHLLLRDRGHETTALGTVAIVGFCPYFWDFKDTVYSEFAFLMFAYAALLVGRRAITGECSPAARVGLGLLAGLLCGLAYGTRSVGIVLVPVLVTCQFLREKRVTAGSVSLIATFAVVAGVNKSLFHYESGYLSAYLSHASVREVVASPWYYVRCLGVPWENGYSRLVQGALYIILGVVASFGAAVRWRAGHRLIELFSVAYFLLVLPFYWGGRRYLMPLFPFFIFFALCGLRAMTARQIGWPRFVLPTLLAMAVGGTFVARYTTLNWHEIPGGTQSAEWQEVLECIRSESDAEGVMVFRKARLLALYSGRAACDILESEDAVGVLDFYRESGVQYVVTSTVFQDSAEAALERLVNHAPERFELLHANEAFALYRFRLPTGSRSLSQGLSEKAAGRSVGRPGTGTEGSSAGVACALVPTSAAGAGVPLATIDVRLL